MFLPIPIAIEIGNIGLIQIIRRSGSTRDGFFHTPQPPKGGDTP
jgi:hypothetical protein